MMDMKISHYGEERDLICTEEERQIYNLVCNEFPEEDLRLVRASENYVTIRSGDWDVARIKYTNRAKWLMFPTIESAKHEIEAPEDVEDFFAAIHDSIEHINEYQ